MRWAAMPTPALPAPPAGVNCFAVAATLAPRRNMLAEQLTGDGLVPLHSALGQHDDPYRHRLAFEPAHQHVMHRTGHPALLGSQPLAQHMLNGCKRRPRHRLRKTSTAHIRQRKRCSLSASSGHLALAGCFVFRLIPMSKQTLNFQSQKWPQLQSGHHSLYSNKEIFLRELVSNASDALRQTAL